MKYNGLSVCGSVFYVAAYKVSMVST